MPLPRPRHGRPRRARWSTSRRHEGLRQRRHRASRTSRSRSSRASSSSSSARPARGKSTTMRLLIKETEPTAGEILVAGRDLATIPRRRVPVLPPQPRRRLPGLQAAAEPHGLRQRRLRAPGDRRQRGARSATRCRTSCASTGLSHQAPQLPRPALRRRAAARLDRARVRQPPAAAARRRADRQPRSRDLDRDHAAALPDQPHRHDRVVVATHDDEMVDKMRRRVIELADGRIVRDEQAGAYTARDESTREFARCARCAERRASDEARLLPPRGAARAQAQRRSRASPRWPPCSSPCSCSASSSRSCRPPPAPPTRCAAAWSPTST